ncbi:hypothetical protein R1sor_024756 [Riccia sorocarpa]|uniref:Clp R domain-containing protein n=1 Tax=Riccia sorocarpa TaxID=122646 RepID=A0ABD3GUJ7_9MARC
MATVMVHRAVTVAAAPLASSSSSIASSVEARQTGAVSWSCLRSQSVLSSAQCLSQATLFAAAPVCGKRTRQQGVICMVLPTANPVKEGQATGAQGQAPWSARAIKSFSMAELEARKLKYPNTGTEALLMGILTEGTSQAAKYLRANGVSLFGVRDEVIKLLGKADMYFFSPEHPPLTEQAQKALDWAIQDSSKLGLNGEVTATCMLLGIWAQKGSAGQKVLETLGFDDKKAEEVRERAAKSEYD